MLLWLYIGQGVLIVLISALACFIVHSKKDFLFNSEQIICRLKEFDDVLQLEEINMKILKKLCFNG
jgi:hypothetical protein